MELSPGSGLKAFRWLTEPQERKAQKPAVSLTRILFTCCCITQFSLKSTEIKVSQTRKLEDDVSVRKTDVAESVGKVN